MRSIQRSFSTIDHAKPHISIAYGAAYQRHNCGVAVVIRDTWQKLSKACTGKGEGWKKKKTRHDPEGWHSTTTITVSTVCTDVNTKSLTSLLTKLRKATLSSPRKCTIIVSNPTTWSRLFLESRDWAEGSRVSVRVSLKYASIQSLIHLKAYWLHIVSLEVNLFGELKDARGSWREPAKRNNDWLQPIASFHCSRYWDTIRRTSYFFLAPNFYSS